MADNNTMKGGKQTSRNVSQILNPQTGHYIKRDVDTGLFIAAKQDGKPFEGVIIEKGTPLPTHPKLSKALASKIERAFLKVNSRSFHP